MSNLQRWILREIVRRIVRQGHWHEANVIEYYRIMNEALAREFTEDNTPTLRKFAEDCFYSALG